MTLFPEFFGRGCLCQRKLKFVFDKVSAVLELCDVIHEELEIEMDKYIARRTEFGWVIVFKSRDGHPVIVDLPRSLKSPSLWVTNETMPMERALALYLIKRPRRCGGFPVCNPYCMSDLFTRLYP